MYNINEGSDSKMLIEFSVGNYLSFKEIVTLSMIPTRIREHATTHIFQPQKEIKLLKSAIVYGANASGKTNLFKALSFMTSFVKNSSKDFQAEEAIAIEPFRLSTETIDSPSFFEVVFLHDSVQYRYGFEVDTSHVKKEWLYASAKQKEKRLFERNQQEFELSPAFNEGKGLEQKTRPNALFLSVVAQFNGKIATELMKWFNQIINISGLDDQYKKMSLALLEDNTYKNIFIELIQAADLGIEDIKLIEEDLFLGRRSSLPLTNVITRHKKYDENNQVTDFEDFNMATHESHGTRKLFSLLGPILTALQNGKVLFVDEFDSRLHTLLSSFIVSIFNSINQNPKNSQLIINTHDTNLLSRKLFRRDQIWFTQKDRYGASELYSLVEYNKVRNDASFEKDYLLGKYGAIPFIPRYTFSQKGNED